MRSGTSKGSTISQYGCSMFGALAAEAQLKKKKKNQFVSLMEAHFVPCAVLTLSVLTSYIYIELPIRARTVNIYVY